MNNMQLFQNSEFGKVRVFIKDGEPVFHAKDVCDCIEIANHSQACMRLDKDEKGLYQTDTLGGNQSVLVITESGLYNLIIRSDAPKAKAFKRWVTHTVLPSIRKTGSFSTNNQLQPMSDSELMAKALIAAKSTIDRIEAERKAERAIAEEKLSKAICERDDAVARRAQISSSREARALGAYGNEKRKNEALTKENAQLKEKLGIESKFTVKSIPWVYKYFDHNANRGKLKANVLNRLGTALSLLCKEKGIELHDCDKVCDGRGDRMNAYPASVVNLIEQYVLSRNEGNYYYRLMSDYLKPEYRAG